MKPAVLGNNQQPSYPRTRKEAFENIRKFAAHFFNLPNDIKENKQEQFNECIKLFDRMNRFISLEKNSPKTIGTSSIETQIEKYEPAKDFFNTLSEDGKQKFCRLFSLISEEEMCRQALTTSQASQDESIKKYISSTIELLKFMRDIKLLQENQTFQTNYLKYCILGKVISVDGKKDITQDFFEVNEGLNDDILFKSNSTVAEGFPGFTSQTLVGLLKTAPIHRHAKIDSLRTGKARYFTNTCLKVLTTFVFKNQNDFTNVLAPLKDTINSSVEMARLDDIVGKLECKSMEVTEDITKWRIELKEIKKINDYVFTEKFINDQAVKFFQFSKNPGTDTQCLWNILFEVYRLERDDKYNKFENKFKSLLISHLDTNEQEKIMKELKQWKDKVSLYVLTKKEYDLISKYNQGEELSIGEFDSLQELFVLKLQPGILGQHNIKILEYTKKALGLSELKGHITEKNQALIDECRDGTMFGEQADLVLKNYNKAYLELWKKELDLALNQGVLKRRTTDNYIPFNTELMGVVNAVEDKSLDNIESLTVSAPRLEKDVRLLKEKFNKEEKLLINKCRQKRLDNQFRAHYSIYQRVNQQYNNDQTNYKLLKAQYAQLTGKGSVKASTLVQLDESKLENGKKSSEGIELLLSSGEVNLADEKIDELEKLVQEFVQNVQDLQTSHNSLINETNNLIKLIEDRLDCFKNEWDEITEYLTKKLGTVFYTKEGKEFTLDKNANLRDFVKAMECIAESFNQIRELFQQVSEETKLDRFKGKEPVVNSLFTRLQSFKDSEDTLLKLDQETKQIFLDLKQYELHLSSSAYKILEAITDEKVIQITKDDIKVLLTDPFVGAYIKGTEIANVLANFEFIDLLYQQLLSSDTDDLVFQEISSIKGYGYQPLISAILAKVGRYNKFAKNLSVFYKNRRVITEILSYYQKLQVKNLERKSLQQFLSELSEVSNERIQKFGAEIRNWDTDEGSKDNISKLAELENIKDFELGRILVGEEMADATARTGEVTVIYGQYIKEGLKAKLEQRALYVEETISVKAFNPHNISYFSSLMGEAHSFSSDVSTSKARPINEIVSDQLDGEQLLVSEVNSLFVESGLSSRFWGPSQEVKPVTGATENSSDKISVEGGEKLIEVEVDRLHKSKLNQLMRREVAKKLIIPVNEQLTRMDEKCGYNYQGDGTNSIFSLTALLLKQYELTSNHKKAQLDFYNLFTTWFNYNSKSGIRSSIDEIIAILREIDNIGKKFIGDSAIKGLVKEITGKENFTFNDIIAIINKDIKSFNSQVRFAGLLTGLQGHGVVEDTNIQVMLNAVCSEERYFNMLYFKQQSQLTNSDAHLSGDGIDFNGEAALKVLKARKAEAELAYSNIENLGNILPGIDNTNLFTAISYLNKQLDNFINKINPLVKTDSLYIDTLLQIISDPTLCHMLTTNMSDLPNDGNMVTRLINKLWPFEKPIIETEAASFKLIVTNLQELFKQVLVKFKQEITEKHWYILDSTSLEILKSLNYESGKLDEVILKLNGLKLPAIRSILRQRYLQEFNQGKVEVIKEGITVENKKEWLVEFKEFIKNLCSNCAIDVKLLYPLGAREDNRLLFKEFENYLAKNKLPANFNTMIQFVEHKLNQPILLGLRDKKRDDLSTFEDTKNLLAYLDRMQLLFYMLQSKISKVVDKFELMGAGKEVEIESESGITIVPPRLVFTRDKLDSTVQDKVQYFLAQSSHKFIHELLLNIRDINNLSIDAIRNQISDKFLPKSDELLGFDPLPITTLQRLEPNALGLEAKNRNATYFIQYLINIYMYLAIQYKLPLTSLIAGLTNEFNRLAKIWSSRLASTGKETNNYAETLFDIELLIKLHNSLIPALNIVKHKMYDEANQASNVDSWERILYDKDAGSLFSSDNTVLESYSLTKLQDQRKVDSIIAKVQQEGEKLVKGKSVELINDSGVDQETQIVSMMLRKGREITLSVLAEDGKLSTKGRSKNNLRLGGNSGADLLSSGFQESITEVSSVPNSPMQRQPLSTFIIRSSTEPKGLKQPGGLSAMFNSSKQATVTERSKAAQKELYQRGYD